MTSIAYGVGWVGTSPYRVGIITMESTEYIPSLSYGVRLYGHHLHLDKQQALTSLHNVVILP